MRHVRTLIAAALIAVALSAATAGVAGTSAGTAVRADGVWCCWPPKEK